MVKKISFDERIARLKAASSETHEDIAPPPAPETTAPPRALELTHDTTSNASRVGVIFAVSILVLAAIAFATVLTSENAFFALAG